MNNDYAYISVKLDLRDGQTEDSIQEIVQEMDYSFRHSAILNHEIMSIIDIQVEGARRSNPAIDRGRIIDDETLRRFGFTARKRRIIKLKDDGVSVRAIVRLLNEEGQASGDPKRYSSAFVYSVLRKYKEKREEMVMDRILVELKQSGMTLEEVAAAECVKIGRVIKAMRRYNNGEA